MRVGDWDWFSLEDSSVEEAGGATTAAYWKGVHDYILYCSLQSLVTEWLGRRPYLHKEVLVDDYDVERPERGLGYFEASREAVATTIFGDYIFIVEWWFSSKMSSTTPTSREGIGVQCRREARVDSKSSQRAIMKCIQFWRLQYAANNSTSSKHFSWGFSADICSQRLFTWNKISNRLA